MQSRKNLLLVEQEFKERCAQVHAQNLQYRWAIHARPNQWIPRGDWRIWLILAGRGFGKTRAGAETIRRCATSGHHKNICLLGDTVAEARRVMVEGTSGLLAVRLVKTAHCMA